MRGAPAQLQKCRAGKFSRALMYRHTAGQKLKVQLPSSLAISANSSIMIYFGIAQFKIEPQEGALHADQQPNNVVTHHEKSSMTELALPCLAGCSTSQYLWFLLFCFVFFLCPVVCPFHLSPRPCRTTLAPRPECSQRNTKKGVKEINSWWAEDHL
jgi:hypothetical protein